MVDDFLEFIKRMGIFLICAESILYFSPGSSYQKYIRVLIGFMLLMQFMIPVKAILSGQDKAAIENQVNEFRWQLERAANEKNDFLHFPSQEEMVNESIAEEVKSRLNHILEAENKNYLVKTVEIGKITSVIIVPSLSSQHTDNDEGKIHIGSITIDKIDIGEISEEKSRITRQEKEDIIALFCRELGTSKEYLEVLIDE